MGMHQLPKAHPQRTIQSVVLSCTFFQHVTVRFHLYTSFKFLELFVYCVPLSASLRTGFSQNENIAF